MLYFESFGSGSSGNLYYIKTEEGAFFIDAGVGIRKLKKYLREYGISLGQIDGILVTHNHVDHVRSLGLLNQKDHLTVYMTRGVRDGIMENPVITRKPLTETSVIIEKQKPFTLAGAEITAFEVPHDSKDNVGYLIRHNNVAFCIVTDCGQWTREIEDHVSQATHLVVESNYDRLMLSQGPYPARLQHRISNGYGHFENALAADVIRRHQHHLRHVWLCHLSENNNTPRLALQSARAALNENSLLPIDVLDRTLPSRLFQLC